MRKINPIVTFIGSLLLGIGGWIITLNTWQDATTPVALGGLVLIVGGILAPATSDSILERRK